MDKNTLLFIFVLFLISSQLWNITWNVGTSLFYIVVAIMVLNSISPDAATSIKQFMLRIINLDTSLITNGLASLSKFLLGLFSSSNEIIQESKEILNKQMKGPEEIQKVESEKVTSRPPVIPETPKRKIIRKVKVPTSMAQLATELAKQQNLNQPSEPQINEPQPSIADSSLF